jgi:4-amino-4-deoxy-L-arabinose transferase-like glycosyltransferase
LKQSFQNRLESGANGIFLLSWSLFPCIFFSLSKSKLPGYILPTIPVLALLCSRGVTKLLNQSGSLSRTILFATSVVPPILIAGVLRYSHRFFCLSSFNSFLKGIGYQLEIAFIAFGFIVYLAILAAPVLIVLRRAKIGVSCTLAGLVAFLFIAGLTIAARLDCALSPRTESRALAQLQGKDVELLLCSVPRSYSYGYAYYLRREIPEWDRQSSQRRALVVLGPGCWNEIKKPHHHLQSEPFGELLTWPVISVEPQSANTLPRSGQPQ